VSLLGVAFLAGFSFISSPRAFLVAAALMKALIAILSEVDQGFCCGEAVGIFLAIRSFDLFYL
jgi:hypothetical protein